MTKEPQKTKEGAVEESEVEEELAIVGKEEGERKLTSPFGEGLESAVMKEEGEANMEDKFKLYIVVEDYMMEDFPALPARDTSITPTPSPNPNQSTIQRDTTPPHQTPDKSTPSIQSIPPPPSIPFLSYSNTTPFTSPFGSFPEAGPVADAMRGQVTSAGGDGESDRGNGKRKRTWMEYRDGDGDDGQEEEEREERDREKREERARKKREAVRERVRIMCGGKGLMGQKFVRR
ncbi:hypothetical protein HYALB_00006755 [Hymenoscyphus albidus]|uniref:Uncharacterized protein n=1 Tax=Hymenoscyphus albidus TaxID=595503 RepID=A0A9N9Q8E7_9HELO|nr:hypothetical protein HYALB_00006755 [Hymenoscyphus albidus]